MQTNPAIEQNHGVNHAPATPATHRLYSKQRTCPIDG